MLPLNVHCRWHCCRRALLWRRRRKQPTAARCGFAGWRAGRLTENRGAVLSRSTRSGWHSWRSKCFRASGLRLRQIDTLPLAQFRRVICAQLAQNSPLMMIGALRLTRHIFEIDIKRLRFLFETLQIVIILHDQCL
jgi:hypothetical protein